MKFKIVIGKLNPIYQRFLEADYHYFQRKLELELYECLDKLRNDRGLSLKLLRGVGKVLPSGYMVNLTYNSFLASLETLEGIQLIDYKISHKGKTSTVEVEIHDLYLSLVKALRTNPMGRFSKIGMTAKEFVRKSEKTLKKHYHTKQVTIETIEPPKSDPEKIGGHDGKPK